MNTGPSFAEIAGMLARQAPSLAAELLPNGKREGAEWRVGSLAGEPGRSLSVHLFGSRAGVWSDSLPARPATRSILSQACSIAATSGRRWPGRGAGRSRDAARYPLNTGRRPPP